MMFSIGLRGNRDVGERRPGMEKVLLPLLAVFASTTVCHNLCFATRVIHSASHNDVNTDVLAVKDGKAYVGGKNYFLEINLDKTGKETVNRVMFSSTEESRTLCLQYTDGRNCHNFVRILKFTSLGSILACGTNGKDPKCYGYNQEDATFTEVEFNARAWMPNIPTGELMSLLTESSELYVLYVRSGRASGVLYRRIANKILRTGTDWFGGVDSEFIWMYDVPDKNYIYIFFNEKSSVFVRDKFDANNQKKDYYSMVARVCKNDMGGSVYKMTWVTFSKVRLACPWTKVKRDETVKLYYDELISVHSYGESFFGLFRANRNWGLEMYALAEFDTNVIDEAIDGKLFADKRTHYYHPTNPNLEVFYQPTTGKDLFEPGQCPTTPTYTLEHKFEQFVIDNALVKMNVFPKQETPFFVGRSQIEFKYIFVQKFVWCNAIFLLRGDGYFKKMILLLNRSVIELYEQKSFLNSDHILAASLVEDKNIILATTATKVISFSLANCSVYTNCGSCHADPHCLWGINALDREFTCAAAASSIKRSCSADAMFEHDFLGEQYEEQVEEEVSPCLGITIALAIVAILFVCCVFIILHLFAHNETEGGELSDLGVKSHESAPMEGDKVLMSTTISTSI